MFPGINFFLVGRYKAEESIGKKLISYMKGEKNFYDIVGYRIIVKHVPENIRINGYRLEDIIENNCEDLNLINIYKKFLLENQKISDYMESLDKENNEDKELFIKDMNNMDNLKTDFMSYVILNQLLEESEQLKIMGIEAVPNRKKNVTGGETGWYFSMHNTVKSKYIKDFYAEIQSTSYWKYKLSLTKGDHKLMPSKSAETDLLKKLTPPENKNNLLKYYASVKSFSENVRRFIPEYIVYQPKGNVHKCTLLEDFCIQYDDLLQKQDTDIQTKNIITRTMEVLAEYDEKNRKDEQEDFRKRIEVSIITRESNQLEDSNNECILKTDSKTTKKEPEF